MRETSNNILEDAVYFWGELGVSVERLKTKVSNLVVYALNGFPNHDGRVSGFCERSFAFLIVVSCPMSCSSGRSGSGGNTGRSVI